MGDELHNRHTASSSLFANAMAVAMAQTELPKDKALWDLKICHQPRTDLPGYRHGLWEGDRRSGNGDRVQHGGNRHVPQRHRVWDPR